MGETEWVPKQWHTGRNEMELKVIPGITYKDLHSQAERGRNVEQCT